jgi:hypothetical protein
MDTDILEGLLQRALANLDDHEDSANRKLFFSILSQVWESGDVDIREAEGYAEPGYADPDDCPILLANWNAETRWNKETNKSETISKLMPLLGEFAEAVGCSIEWSDEWEVCECQKAFRTSPDSHGWTMFGAFIEDMAVCGECILEDPEPYFETISGNPRMAITINGLNPEDYGFVKINDESFEYGLHGGQNASSDSIARTLKSSGIEDFLFSVDSAGQFDMKFSVYVRGEERDAAVVALQRGNTTCEVDPARALEQGLKAASDAMSKLQKGDGVKVASVDLGDGTATARTVTAEEFVNGVKI